MRKTEQDILQVASVALRKAALNEDAKHFILQNDKLYKMLKRAANRYIAGETIQETVPFIKKLNDSGFLVTTDFMGESVRNETEANEATNEFIKFARVVESENLNSSISLDLSHIGLLVSEDLAVRNLKSICAAVQDCRQEVILSMEGTDRTDSIIGIYEEVLKEHANLGITLQAYLHRTKKDMDKLLKLSGSIRLVKGAYDTPLSTSIPRGDRLDEVYLEYVAQLLEANHKCSIASHHTKIQDEAIKMIHQYSATNYVLERLLGIGNEELQVYNEKGYTCRIYVVYGREWYLYLCNRWAEYPLNLFRGLSDIMEI
ncbi:MAG: proline dehydrogenase family protein [Cyclobacteriaceae bacterium]|nr:proline dehydrogenase family protein [Cyclobacteriaceae bacterium]